MPTQQEIDENRLKLENDALEAHIEGLKHQPTSRLKSILQGASRGMTAASQGQVKYNSRLGGLEGLLLGASGAYGGAVADEEKKRHERMDASEKALRVLKESGEQSEMFSEDKARGIPAGSRRPSVQARLIESYDKNKRVKDIADMQDATRKFMIMSNTNSNMRNNITSSLNKYAELTGDSESAKILLQAAELMSHGDISFDLTQSPEYEAAVKKMEGTFGKNWPAALALTSGLATGGAALLKGAGPVTAGVAGVVGAAAGAGGASALGQTKPTIKATPGQKRLEAPGKSNPGQNKPAKQSEQTIKVKRKADGKSGTLLLKDYDPRIYELE